MYFVIYDLRDNIVAYIDSLDELAKYFGRRKKQFAYKFKQKNVVQVQTNTVYKVYKFS